MAQPPPPFPVFVDTSLDTHLAVVASPDDTVLDLKRKVLMEHASGFPEIGDISIIAIKVKRRSALYRLSDSMKVGDAFVGIKGSRFLHVDATCTRDMKASAARSSVDILATEDGKLSKSCMPQIKPGACDGLERNPNTKQCHAIDVRLLGDCSAKNAQGLGLTGLFDHEKFPSGGSSSANDIKRNISTAEFQFPEHGTPILLNQNKTEGMTTTEKGIPHCLSAPEMKEGSNISNDEPAKVDHQTKPNMMGNNAETSGTQQNGCDIQDAKKTVDFAGEDKRKKHRKRLKGKGSAEDHAKAQFVEVGTQSNVEDPPMENISMSNPPVATIDKIGTFLDELVDQSGNLEEKPDRPERKRHMRHIGNDHVEQGPQIHAEVAVTEINEPASLETAPHHTDLQIRITGAVDELGYQPQNSNGTRKCIVDNNSETVVPEKRRRKKQKRKDSVEDAAEIESQDLVSKSSGFQFTIETTTEKTSLHLNSEHASDGGIDWVISDSKLNEEKETLSPKITVKRKKKVQHHQVDQEPLAEVDADCYQSKGKSVAKKSKSIRVSGEEFNSTNVDELPTRPIFSGKDVESGIPPTKKVKKPRCKKNVNLGENMTENITFVETQTGGKRPGQSSAVPVDHSADKSGMTIDFRDSEVINGVSKVAGLVALSNAYSSHTKETSADLVPGSSLNSSNKNTHTVLWQEDPMPDNSGPLRKTVNNHDQSVTSLVAGNMPSDIVPDVPPVKRKSKRQKNLQEIENPKRESSNNGINCYSEDLPSFGSAAALKSDNDETLNNVSKDLLDSIHEKMQCDGKKKSRSGKRKPYKTATPDHCATHGSRTPLSQNQNNDNQSSEAIGNHEDPSPKVIEENEKTVTSETCPNIPSKLHRKKSKADPSNERSINSGAMHSSDRPVTQENVCSEINTKLDLGDGCKKATDGAVSQFVSPGSEVGKLDFMSALLPEQNHQESATLEEESVAKESDAGKERMVKPKNARHNTKQSHVRPGEFSPDSVNNLSHENKLQLGSTTGYNTEEPKTVMESGGEIEARQGNSDVPPPNKQTESSKKLEAGEEASKKLDVRAEPNPEGDANPVASSESTEDETPYDTRRYRVAVRKFQHREGGSYTKDSNCLHSTKDSIFDNDSSSSSEDTLVRAALDNYRSASFSSSDSEMALDDTLHSQASAKVIDYRVNTRKKRGDGDNDTRMTDSLVGGLNLSAVLRNSSTYKKAKALASSQKQDGDDSQSQPVDVVPETQPDDLTH